MSEHDIAIALAELRGEVRGYRETVATQLHAIEQDIQREVGRGEEEHSRLDRDLAAAWQAIRAMEARWQRVVGIALGIAVGSGVISGSVVAAIARGLGG